MIATVGVVWAIGFAAYTFVYGYFQQVHLKEAVSMADDPAYPALKHGEKRLHMVCRLRRNRNVYWTFILAGFAAILSISASAFALAYDSSDLLIWAKLGFGGAVGLHLLVFSREILSSVDQMRDLESKIGGSE